MWKDIMCGLIGGTIGFGLDVATAPKDPEDDNAVRSYACIGAGVVIALAIRSCLSKES